MKHDNHALRPIRYAEDAEALADALESNPEPMGMGGEIARLAREAAQNPERHELTSREQ